MNLIKCSPEAREKCPFDHPCDSEEKAYFEDGSPCDGFNKKLNPPKPCPWCKPGWDWDVIDGDFGQYVRHSMIKHCFHCGRRLEEV